MSSREIVVSDWKPLRRGALRGFVTATFPSGMLMHEICVFATNGKFWASPPSKPMLKDGKVLVDDNGKSKYAPLIEFISKAVRDRWSSSIVDALLAEYPEALRDG